MNAAQRQLPKGHTLLPGYATHSIQVSKAGNRLHIFNILDGKLNHSESVCEEVLDVLWMDIDQYIHSTKRTA